MGRTAGIWPYVCLLPALAVFIVLEIVPAFATWLFSLTDYTGLPHTPIRWVGIQNYIDLLTGGQTFLVRALGVTAIFSLLVTVLQNGLAVLIAWLLWRKGLWGRIVMVIGLALLAYSIYIAIYPTPSFYREEFAHRTGIVFPASAKIKFRNASYPDFHGDYESAVLFEVSPQDFETLKRAATTAPAGPRGITCRWKSSRKNCSRPTPKKARSSSPITARSSSPATAR